MNNYSWKQTNSNLNDKASRLNLSISLNSNPNSARFLFINSNSLGKIFKCIWKISFSSFRKCYRLSGSEQPSTFGNSFSDISTLNISQMVTPKPIDHAILWKIWQDLSGALNILPQTVTNFLLSSAENTKKISHLWHWE